MALIPCWKIEILPWREKDREQRKKDGEQRETELGKNFIKTSLWKSSPNKIQGMYYLY